jgi:hypothetical protein
VLRSGPVVISAVALGFFLMLGGAAIAMVVPQSSPSWLKRKKPRSGCRKAAYLAWHVDCFVGCMYHLKATA